MFGPAKKVYEVDAAVEDRSDVCGPNISTSAHRYGTPVGGTTISNVSYDDGSDICPQRCAAGFLVAKNNRVRWLGHNPLTPGPLKDRRYPWK